MHTGRDSTPSKGERRVVAQFGGRTLVPPDRIVVQESQSITLEGIPPVLKLRVLGPDPVETDFDWSSVSRAQQFLLHLRSPTKKGGPKKAGSPPGLLSLVCSVEQPHLLVVLHRLELKSPMRVQINFKLGPEEEVTTPGFRDELNFATVSQDPVTLDAILFEVWAFPRADLLGLCKVPVPQAETALRSELFSWDTGEVIGTLELTLRRAPKSQLQPFLTPKARPRHMEKPEEGARHDASEWMRAGRTSMGKILIAPPPGELKRFSGEDLLQYLLGHVQGLTRNEAIVLVWTIWHHFQGERGLAEARAFQDPFEEMAIPGAFVSFWIDSRQRLAAETIRRLLPRPTPGFIRVLRDKSFGFGEPERLSRPSFVSFLQTHEGMPSWELVESTFKALDEFGGNDLDAVVFARLVLRHEENGVGVYIVSCELDFETLPPAYH